MTFICLIWLCEMNRINESHPHENRLGTLFCARGDGAEFGHIKVQVYVRLTTEISICALTLAV